MTAVSTPRTTATIAVAGTLRRDRVECCGVLGSIAPMVTFCAALRGSSIVMREMDGRRPMRVVRLVVAACLALTPALAGTPALAAPYPPAAPVSTQQCRPQTSPYTRLDTVPWPQERFDY